MQYTEQAPTQPELMNITQVASFLKLSRATVYKLINHEGLPVIPFGRALRVSPASLQQWLSRREKKSSR
jgi:excisionase family DNA binding protein